MWKRSTIGVILLVSVFAAMAGSEEPKRTTPSDQPNGREKQLGPIASTNLNVDQLKDAQTAALAADFLEKNYAGAKQPESFRMLLAALRGAESVGPHDGWFGPANSRFTWQRLAGRHGVNPASGSISREQFRGPDSFFKRLDRNGDGRITADDLDWSERNPWVQQSSLVTRLFRRMNTKGDGKLTREDLDELFKKTSQGKDFVTSDDLRHFLLLPGGYLPGDAPTTPVMVRSLFAGELGSLNEGPRLEEKAPDFTLKSIDTKSSIQLSKLIGPKPVMIVLGNFTCGPFRALYPEVDAVYQRYKDEANFVMVYVREAHPTDGWKMQANAKAGVEVKQPITFGERVNVCDQFCAKLKPTMPVAVDEIHDPVGNAYSGMPSRLYVIDSTGKVAYKSGRGPFGFKVGEMEQALIMCLLEQGGNAPGSINSQAK